MNKNFTDFERSMKEGMEGFEMPYDQGAWQSMERKLEGKKASWNNTMAAAVASVLILLSAATFIVVQTDVLSSRESEEAVNNIDQQEFVEENNISEESNSTIDSDSNDNSQSSEEGGLSNAEGAISENEESSEVSSLITAEITDDTNSDSESRISENNTSNSINVSDSKDGSTSDAQTDVEEPVILNVEKTPKNTAPFIYASSQEVCAGEKVDFSAENITAEAKFLWNFGNADFSTERNPVRVFNEPGEYNISLILSQSSMKIESQIIVLPKPEAKFTWKEQEKGAIKLSNLSEKAASSEWKVGDEFTSSDINPIYNYKEEGKEFVSLKVVNEFGCVDSTFRHIQLKAPMSISAAESLKFGERFTPDVEGLTNEEMTLTIHNLAGQMIYSTTTSKSWKGTMPDGNYAGPGSEFAWLVVIKNSRGVTVSSNSGIVKVVP